MFEYSLVAGLTASGADAYLLHVTTTPSVAYIARVDDFDCVIIWTEMRLRKSQRRSNGMQKQLKKAALSIS